MSFDLSVRQVGASLVLLVEGYLNDLAGEAIEREVEKGLSEGASTVVIDFAGAGLVNSIGVSILVGAVESARRGGAAMVFTRVAAVNREIFEMVGLAPHVSFLEQWEPPA
jgi:anti-anti-sigma factor